MRGAAGDGLKGHQITPCVHMCSSAFAVLSLHSPEICLATKSPPSLTAGLRTQTPRVPASHIRHEKRGEISARDSSEEESHGVSSPFISHRRSHVCSHFQRHCGVIGHQSIHTAGPQETCIHKFHCSLSKLLGLGAFIQLFWGLQRICSDGCTRTTHSGAGK